MSLAVKQKNTIISIPFVGAAGTDTGRQRTNNEDIFIFDANNGFFLVVDGMGGHEKGEVAAGIAAETIQTGIRKIENSAEVRLHDSIILANNAIYERAQKDASNMGCVLTALLVEDETATIGHVGDTRLYKIHDGEINKLTADHSVVGKLEQEGNLSERRLMEHPQRNEVMRCVGIEEKSFETKEFVDIFQSSFESDAALLLCSDGLSDLLTTVEILNIIEENAGVPLEVIAQLIKKANSLGGKDNITAIFLAGKEFASNVRQRQQASIISKKQKFFSFLFHRLAFLIYGILLGATTVCLIFYYLLPAEINAPAP